jgi:hypothetical protein
MGVSLAAITDDGDFPALDQVDVGVTIVINAHWPGVLCVGDPLPEKAMGGENQASPHLSEDVNSCRFADVTSNFDFLRPLPNLRCVIRRLYTQQEIDLQSKCLLDAKR